MQIDAASDTPLDESSSAPISCETLGTFPIGALDETALFTLDCAGFVTSWSSGAERLQGYHARDIIGQHFSTFYPPEAIVSGSPDEQLTQAAMAGRSAEDGWRLRRDSTRFWANIVSTALYSSEGELSGFAQVIRDLSERIEHDMTSPHQSDESLRLLIESVEDYAIFRLDPTGHVASWNSGAQKIKGYRADEIIGQHFSIFYIPEDIGVGKPARELATAISDGRVEDEGWRIRRDGSRFWANVIITAIRDSSGMLRGFAKITRDMTERLRVTELEHASELSAHVQSAREDAQARVARELHDDLGQRLTAIKMDLSLLGADMSACETSQSMLSQIDRVQEQVDAMVVSIRRIAAGLRPPMLDDLGVLAALDWLAKDFTLRYGIHVKKSVAVELEALTFSDAAGTAIFRIVQEALTNVARHAQASEVTIEMDRTGDICSVRIEDNGCGTIIDTPRNEKTFGLLGIQERVRQLHGAAAIDSTLGGGFRIRVDLPVSALETINKERPHHA
jgi:PAS domain S-box-containing protein